MLPYYLILELPPDASDQDIREHYLALVKRHPPEKDPERFRRITEAYEGLKDRRKRVESRIFGVQRFGNPEAALEFLAAAAAVKRRRACLAELLQAAGETA